MTAAELYTRAVQIGLLLFPKRDKLSVSPEKSCSPDLIEELRAHKPEMLAWLQVNAFGSPPSKSETWRAIECQILAGEWDCANAELVEPSEPNSFYEETKTKKTGKAKAMSEALFIPDAHCQALGKRLCAAVIAYRLGLSLQHVYGYKLRDVKLGSYWIDLARRLERDMIFIETGKIVPIPGDHLTEAIQDSNSDGLRTRSSRHRICASTPDSGR